MKALVVDSDPATRDALRQAIAAAGGQVRGLASAAEAARLLPEFRPDVVVASLEALDGELGRLLSDGRSGDGRPETWAIVPALRLDEAVAAMGRGAEDFVWTPISPSRVAVLWERLARRREDQDRAEEARRKLAQLERTVAMAGRSQRWTETMAALEKLAPERAVLVTGEEGTEKEAAARFLHRLSPRGAGPFLRVSVDQDLPEMLARARRGTLFVPGLDRAPALRQQEIFAALDDESGPAIVLAADRDPGEAARTGELSERLLARLEGCVLHLPPLRERGDDVARLARQFLEEASDTLSFDSEAMDALTAHDWPGNVQELREAVRRAARLADGPAIGQTVVQSVLGRPLAARGFRRRKVPVVRIAVGDSLADVERRLIQKTLEFARGNKRKTAELLKLSLKTIYNKIKEYGLEH